MPLRKTIRSLPELLKQGWLSLHQANHLIAVLRRYAMAITPQMAALIGQEQVQAEGQSTPISMQFIPSKQELTVLPSEHPDPVGDEPFSPVPGLIHRYPDRVLLKPVHVCAVYCRFCFRREMVGPKSQTLSKSQLAQAMNYIQSHPAIWEVILSGGDPLILKPAQLSEILAPLALIPHVKIIRFHTRVPVVDSERITDALMDVLRGTGKTVYVALHVNHASEFTPEAIAACARLIDGGIPMVSQSVLLNGVNDSIEALSDLMKTCLVHRIKPYYLHQLDLAPGTAHFRVEIERGQALMRALRGRFSGLCQPEYVIDIPGGFGKVPLTPSYLEKNAVQHDEQTQYCITDYQGDSHAYCDCLPVQS